MFSKAGFGTIVTGTLVRGSLAVGDEIDVLTARGVAQARVRGLQCHGRTLVREDGKARLAVALGSVPEAPLRYGALGARGSLRPTMRLVATLRPLPDATAWPRRGRATLHLGAFATEASFSLLELAADAGVGSVRAFLTLSRPLLAWTGDRFVQRRDAPLGPQTFGGGTVDLLSETYGLFGGSGFTPRAESAGWHDPRELPSPAPAHARFESTAPAGPTSNASTRN